MNCIFLNLNNELDLLVDLARKDELITVHDLHNVDDYRYWDFDEYLPAVVFIHLDSLLSLEKAIQQEIVSPFIYTCFITSDIKKPPEAQFIWNPEVFTLSSAADMLEHVIPIGLDIVKGRHRRKACDKFEVFTLPLLGNRLIRIRAYDIVSIRIIGIKAVQVTTVDQSYMSICDSSFFKNIDLVPDFKYVNSETIINTNMVVEIFNDLIKLQNEEMVKLHEDFQELFLTTIELPSSKFYFRKPPLLFK